MKSQPFLGLVLALLVSFCLGGGAVWVLTATREPAENSSSSASQPTSDAENLSHGEKFFGGDPDRNVRSGQEMKPRW